MSEIIIIGGGAAGMMAAVFAAKNGNHVEVFEKNEKLGKKLYITGKGRCNLTNACETEELFNAVCRNPKFLYSAFYSFTSQDVMDFFEKEAGIPLKTERGNRVFPRSDHSSDIIRGLQNLMKKYGVTVHLNTEVESLIASEERVRGIRIKEGKKEILCDQIIVATGGLSYPSTGSTGDGYRFAKSCGMKVSPCSPSLVPLVTKEDYIPQMQGLSLKNVSLTIFRGNKKVYQDFGEMMFTHYGVTGPMILSASAYIGDQTEKGELKAELDLKPALSPEQLDQRLLREFEGNKNKQLKNVIGVLFPASLTPVFLELCGSSPDKKIHDISREERSRFIHLMKHFPFTITGRGEFKEAIITRGGVSVKEVNPHTMESRKVQGLYFIGEVLDLDAVTGGFNLQIAWSTAYLAAQAAGNERE